MYLVVLLHQWEANLQEKLGLKEIILGGAQKIIRLISCATCINHAIY